MISLICIVSYFFLENSNVIPDLVEKSSKGRYNGFVTFIFTGLFKYVLLVIGVGIIVILSFLLIKEKKTQNSDTKRNIKTNESVKNRTENQNYEKKQDNRILKLVVMYDFAQTSKTISEKTTAELIENNMKSIDWKKFHAVYLQDENGNILDVSGSLYDDGLSSSYVNDDVHLLKDNPPESVEEMTEILLDFLKGEEIWRNKYKYE